ncbi:hypothetical protein Ga0466249_001564 [Sporomusaceae bacterium BoRhaA]|uniref:cellulose biosynthesis cyclic di-GMP-binding regulatory protein BcsB n=1 Tax=Pelorhabdus rhamnosifermentans TaxID=2772457 RepID=UPI001C0629C2|nr:cellulose biosynthesis cyclic di-GMP-binding regulatory protein BcsB [Pelorhabdus rhamnosifermentans]MBU2700472.1 hypothetical protein [Pelorhabdus rhamnosifermentans]
MRNLTKFILLIYLFSLPLATIEAAAYTVPLSVLGYSQDLTIKGSNTATSVFFPLPKASFQAGSNINLYLEPSPYLNDGSTFSIALNDQTAVNLTAGQLKKNSQIQLPIPASAVTAQGVNVTIHTGMFASDDLCADYRKGYLFYTLRQQSNMTMNVIPPSPQTIPDFFAGLYQGLAIVLPQSPSKEEVNAAIWLFGVLQKSYSYQNMKIVIGESQGLPPNTPQLLVAERSHLPQNVQKPVENLYLSAPDKLIVTASSGAELLQVTRQLLTMPAYAALPVAQSTIQSSSQGSALLQDRIYFGNSTVQEGISNIVMDFPLYPGQLTTIPKSLGLHLEGRYSPSTTAGKPTRLDVFFNRNLIHSSVLDDSGVLAKDINLPDNLNLKARNALSVKVSYSENICDVRGTAENAQILPSSYYTGIRSLVGERLTWDSAGLVFNRTGILFLEDNPSTEAIKAAAQAICFLNSQLPPHEFAWPEIRFTSEYEKSLTADYLVLVGSESLPAELTKGLPIQAGQTATVYQGNGQTSQFTYQAGTDAVIGQIGQYQGIPLLAFQSVQSPQKLSEAIYYLTKSLVNLTATGNLYIYSDKPIFLSTLSPSIPEKIGVTRFLSIPWNLLEQAYHLAGSYYRFLFLAILIIVAFVAFRWFIHCGGKGKH